MRHHATPEIRNIDSNKLGEGTDDQSPHVLLVVTGNEKQSASNVTLPHDPARAAPTYTQRR